MNIINFLIQLLNDHGSDVIVVLAFIGVLFLLFKKGQKDLAKKIIYNLVVKAEQQLGSSTGQLKFNLVYASLPFIVRMFLTKKEIAQLITWAVEELKTYLGGGKNLLTYSQEVDLVAALAPEEIPSNAEINNIP